ncbi:MAG TPA: hypothetical protein VIH15_02425 [Casimicrobiaceae bacterium]|jgi:hypothetical protein
MHSGALDRIIRRQQLATIVVGQFVTTFKEFSPSQVSGSLGVEKAPQALQEGGRQNRMARRSPSLDG